MQGGEKYDECHISKISTTLVPKFKLGQVSQKGMMEAVKGGEAEEIALLKEWKNDNSISGRSSLDLRGLVARRQTGRRGSRIRAFGLMKKALWRRTRRAVLEQRLKFCF